VCVIVANVYYAVSQILFKRVNHLHRRCAGIDLSVTNIHVMGNHPKGPEGFLAELDDKIVAEKQKVGALGAGERSGRVRYDGCGFESYFPPKKQLTALLEKLLVGETSIGEVLAPGLGPWPPLSSRWGAIFTRIVSLPYIA